MQYSVLVIKTFRVNQLISRENQSLYDDAEQMGIFMIGQITYIINQDSGTEMLSFDMIGREHCVLCKSWD